MKAVHHEYIVSLFLAFCKLFTFLFVKRKKRHALSVTSFMIKLSSFCRKVRALSECLRKAS